jgi:hypothetical protein
MVNENTAPKSRFSRRHVDGAAHAEAQMAREARIAKQAEEAEANRQARANRSASDQLAVLDKRLGKGKGAERERARLNKQITEERLRSAERKARKVTSGT